MKPPALKVAGNGKVKGNDAAVAGAAAEPPNPPGTEMVDVERVGAAVVARVVVDTAVAGNEKLNNAGEKLKPVNPPTAGAAAEVEPDADVAEPVFKETLRASSDASSPSASSIRRLRLESVVASAICKTNTREESKPHSVRQARLAFHKLVQNCVQL